MAAGSPGEYALLEYAIPPVPFSASGRLHALAILSVSGIKTLELFPIITGQNAATAAAHHWSLSFRHAMPISVNRR